MYTNVNAYVRYSCNGTGKVYVWTTMDFQTQCVCTDVTISRWFSLPYACAHARWPAHARKSPDVCYEVQYEAVLWIRVGQIKRHLSLFVAHLNCRH